MALFSWFKPKSDSHAEPGTPPAASPHPGRAYTSQREPEGARPLSPEAERLKSERAKMREQLYAVVRESMVRVGFLSSNFKFKVLAADPKGHRFIVMMDLPHTFGGDISQLAEIEPVICRTARVRHGLTVAAVYWRAELPQPSAAAQASQPPASVLPQRPVPAATTAPAPVAPQPTAAPVAPPPVAAPPTPAPDHKPGFDPVLADEVSALKRVLAAGGSVLTANIGGPPKTNPVMLTGYEATEIIDSQMPADSRDNQATLIERQPEDDPFPLLSPTQYGELR